MKYLLPVLCAVAVLSGCAKEKKDPEVVVPPAVVEAPIREVDYDQLQDRKGVWYFPNEDKPFTGVGVRKHPNGQKEHESPYKDGELDGLETWWYENGQKRGERTYKDGKRHGLWTVWYENGQKKVEVTWKEGEIISSKFWNENGNPY